MKARENTKILVADDEPHVRELICRYLSAEGYQCAHSRDGAQALKMLEDDYDLLLADIIMPGMNGVDLLNVVGRLYPDVAVLLVTGVDDRDTGILAIESGAYGYITKPFKRNDILINVAMALQRREEKLSRVSGEPKEHHTSSRAVRPQPPGIVTQPDGAGEVHSGFDDVVFLEEFGSSVGGHDACPDRLSPRARSEESNSTDVTSLSPEVVNIDSSGVSWFERDMSKQFINARDAVNCIQSGMNADQVMKRYQISESNLRNLLKQLVDGGHVSEEECLRWSDLSTDRYDEVRLRLSPSHELSVLTLMHDSACQQIRGRLQKIGEDELAIVGIDAAVGETRTLIIPAKPYLDRDNIWLEARCSQAGEDKHGSPTSTNFQITAISEEHRANLRELALLLSESSGQA